MTRSVRVCALTLLCFRAQAALAQADPDLDRIPAAQIVEKAPLPSVDRNLYWQTDLTYTGPRHDLAVPLSPAPSWEARGFLDMRFQQHFGEAWSAAYSGRFNLRAEEGLGFANRENARNDLREAFVAWTDNLGWFLQFGRINLKSGVAEGFNPTDYFKTRAVVEPTSIDPAVLREDRLGVVMLQTQWIGTASSLTFALAPKLAVDSPPYEGNSLPSFNPMFDRTNARVRALLKASFSTSNGMAPEFLAYEEGGSTRFGVNVSNGVGRAAVAYLEWSGGQRVSLAEEALEEGRSAKVLFGAVPIPTDDIHRFSNDLAVGFSYTTRVGISLAAEFDYHQAGFSAVDWRNWFGTRSVGTGAVSAQLWFIRGYAGEQQEPMARSSLFLRAYWRNAWVKDLTLSSFVDIDLHDDSALTQFSADYYLSPSWTVGVLIDAYGGARRSDFGSLPQTGSFLLKLTRYL